jgi:GR25 family glycosyltransferase involved in LPS biosynthesis
MEKVDKIFLINLDRREDRLDEFMKKYPIAKNSLTRYSAADGQKLKMTESIKHLFRNNKFNWLGGKIGCALSHYNIWVENKENNIIVVLEDDIEFVSNFKKLWREMYKDLPKDFDYIPLNMEYYIEEYKVSGKKNRKDVFGQKISEYNKSFYKVNDTINSIGNFGTCGYIISKNGIKKLLDKVESEGFINEVDIFINNTELNVYLPKKYLITHNSFGGTDVSFYGDKSII